MTRELDVALRTARQAGRCILEFQDRLSPDTLGFKGVRDLVTGADLASERILVDTLRGEFPDHLVLAEEEVSGAARRAARGADAGDRPEDASNDLEPLRRRMGEVRHCWLIDPLDGTTNFAHRHPFHAVSVALYEEGAPLLAVVHAPALGETWVAERGRGTTCNDRPARVSAAATLTDAVFATGFPYRRERMPDSRNNIAHMNRFLREVRGFRRCGSAAIDLAFVASGRYAFFFEQQLEPWDVAAGALLVREAGGTVTDYQGGEDWLFGRQILASNGILHETARARLGE